jgi:6-pyruvoyltetrahydropterin/6-carboxytetrahydropterin synthase
MLRLRRSFASLHSGCAQHDSARGGTGEGADDFLTDLDNAGRGNCTAPEGFMFEVTVEDSFAAGHYLRNYKGKCENPHGHNYKIRVTLAGAELDKAGLLLDFKELREVMKHVIDRLDHQMINDIEPFTAINPSAENLAKYFYDESNTRLQSVTKGRVRVKDVTVFETDTTTAKYSE